MNNLNKTNVINNVDVALLATSKVDDESVGSCQCRICRESTPVAYINNELSSCYKLHEDFWMSVYADMYLVEVLGMDISEMDSIERHCTLQEIVEEFGVINFIFDYIDAFFDAANVEWYAQCLSEDENEFHILCQLKCNYSIPEKFISSTFPNFIYGVEEEATLPQKRYHARSLGEGYALPLVDNFIFGLCKELGVYVDTQFEDTL